MVMYARYIAAWDLKSARVTVKIQQPTWADIIPHARQ